MGGHDDTEAAEKQGASEILEQVALGEFRTYYLSGDKRSE